MPKGSPELTVARKDEIIDACEKLYETKNFKDITLKDISEVTSFTRTSIYNYFQTKEEIFLALFEREYDKWNKELARIRDSHGVLSYTELAENIATSLANHRLLLKLLLMNNADIESNSRMECLVSFKTAYGLSMKLVAEILKKFCPDKTSDDIQGFIYVFFPFMYGIYPYTQVTPEQKEAMSQAHVDYIYQSIFELTNACILRLLNAR